MEIKKFMQNERYQDKLFEIYEKDDFDILYMSFMSGYILQYDGKDILLKLVDDYGRYLAMVSKKVDSIEGIVDFGEYTAMLSKKIEIQKSNNNFDPLKIIDDDASILKSNENVMHNVLKYTCDNKKIISIDIEDEIKPVEGFIKIYDENYVLIEGVSRENIELLGTKKVELDEIKNIEFNSINSYLLEKIYKNKEKQIL